MTRHFCLVFAVILCICSTVWAAVPLTVKPQPANPPLSEASLKHERWLHKVTLEAYDVVGNRNPKWDDAARRALAIPVDTFGPPRFTVARDMAQFNVAKSAIDAGCDDPMVLYVYARTFFTFGNDPAKCIEIHQRAADGLLHSKYSPYYRALSLMRAAELMMRAEREREIQTKHPFDQQLWKEILGRVQVAMDLTKDVAADHDVPLEDWIKLGDGLNDVFGRGMGNLVNAVSFYPAFEKNAPKTAALTVEGYLYTEWGWEARGSGFSNTVTPEGWKLMRDRLDTAQKSFEEAWKLDNSNSMAATGMLRVEQGQGQGRDRMELWFKRAMEANPDNYLATSYKLYYLEPKWYGSKEDMLQFGRECLKTGRFHTNIPFILWYAHEQLSHYTHGAYQSVSDAAYYQTPGVWTDLRDVYDGYLNVEKPPRVFYTRNCYARDACKCQDWDDATKMFATIGEDLDLRVWNKQQFEAARAQAIESAKK